jgi:hypothetical protein
LTGAPHIARGAGQPPWLRVRASRRNEYGPSEMDILDYMIAGWLPWASSQTSRHPGVVR